MRRMTRRASVVAEGPKVFAFEALENFDLSVGTADYLQPFRSVVIELPADYARKRVVPFEGGSHALDFVVARHEPQAGCVLLLDVGWRQAAPKSMASPRARPRPQHERGVGRPLGISEECPTALVGYSVPPAGFWLTRPSAAGEIRRFG
jgi:hypothetical protein